MEGRKAMLVLQKSGPPALFRVRDAQAVVQIHVRCRYAVICDNLRTKPYHPQITQISQIITLATRCPMVVTPAGAGTSSLCLSHLRQSA